MRLFSRDFDIFSSLFNIFVVVCRVCFSAESLSLQGDNCLCVYTMEINTLHSIDTQEPADTVEWCTHPDYMQYFVCGTYHLEKDDKDFSQPPTSMLG